MTLTPRDRILLVAIAVVLAGFGFFHFALSPARHRAANLEPKIAAARTQLVQAQGKYAAGRAAAGTLRTSAPSFTAAERAVPAEADIPALLRLLQRGAREAHVSMQSISLSGPSATSTSASPASPSAPITSGATTGSSGATEIPVSLTFEGGYQALNRLVARLDRLVTVSGNRVHAAGPLVGISNVSLSGMSGASLTVNLTAVIYQRSAAPTAVSGTGATEGSS